MKRFLPLTFLAVLSFTACDGSRMESLVEPEVDGPSMAKEVLPQLSVPEDCQNCLAGPEILVRKKGAPETAWISFDAVQGQEAELVVLASDPRTTTVKAWLNEKVVLLPSAIPQAAPDPARAPLVLEAENVLIVRLTAKPGSTVAVWVETGEVPDARTPLWTDVGVVPTGSPATPMVVADDQGMAFLLLADPESGVPQGAAAFLSGMNGPGLVRFDPSGVPTAAFFGGGAAYLGTWNADGGVASVTVHVPAGSALPEALVSVALPEAFVPVVSHMLTSTPIPVPGGVYGPAELEALSRTEALVSQAAWCALEVAGTLPASADACRPTLLGGIPHFWEQWTEAIGFEPFLPTVVGSLNLPGCAGTQCISQAETLTFATIAGATPGKLIVHSGDAQTGAVGSALAEPIQVLLTNAFDVPLTGFLADFEVASGGGILDGAGATASAATGGDGVAGASWTLGSAVGEQHVGVTTVAFGDLGVTFSATGEEATSSTVFRTTDPSSLVSPSADMNAACAGEFGADFGIADWTDVVAAVAGGTPKDAILAAGMAMIRYNGVGVASSGWSFVTEHYMLSTFDLGDPTAPTVGPEWFWLAKGASDQRVLCIGPTS